MVAHQVDRLQFENVQQVGHGQGVVVDGWERWRRVGFPEAGCIRGDRQPVAAHLLQELLVDVAGTRREVEADERPLGRHVSGWPSDPQVLLAEAAIQIHPPDPAHASRPSCGSGRSARKVRQSETVVEKLSGVPRPGVS
ncbi:MAG: hypothetical protein KatS3mg061_3054 [Dehalococcoidia bacterium]|nr:MAG: hypothetical protein KatS3mg061_3054 [Dehalococcoidia bacterium]